MVISHSKKYRGKNEWQEQSFIKSAPYNSERISSRTHASRQSNWFSKCARFSFEFEIAFI